MKGQQVFQSGILALAVTVSTVALAAPEKLPSVAAHHEQDTYYAVVNGERISMREYQLALQSGMRQRFYHGKIPEAQLAAFRQEVSQELIDRVLLLREARRLKLSPDASAIRHQIDAYEKRYASSEHWQKNRKNMLPGLQRTLEEQSLLRVLESQVRKVGSPSANALQAYYAKNPGLFTTPEQLELSLIMLKVAPSAGTAAWEAAQAEADALVSKLRRGADFASLARIHSGDQSASQGGRLEALHQGMLAAPVQKVVDKLKAGEVGDPVVTLQGIAIVRLERRIEARLNPLDRVRDRAVKLWQREQADQAWSDLRETLRSSATVSINSAAL